MQARDFSADRRPDYLGTGISSVLRVDVGAVCGRFGCSSCVAYDVAYRRPLVDRAWLGPKTSRTGWPAQVNMIVLAVELHQFRLEIGADAGKDAVRVKIVVA